MCNEIINVADSISRIVINTVPRNDTSTVLMNVVSTVSTDVTGTVPINSDVEIVRYKVDCYILNILLLVTNQ